MEDFLIKALLVIFLSGMIGIEREIKHKAAGFRTHLLVGLAAFSFTYFSISYFEKMEASRIISNILVGMGFIGAGTIIKGSKGVIGVTTAASLWFVSCLGVLVGLGYLLEAMLLSFLGFLILLSKKIYSIILKNKNGGEV